LDLLRARVSDILGRHTVRLNNTAEKRQELAQRLQSAGCPVDLTGTNWHKAGDFNHAIELEELTHSTEVAVGSGQKVVYGQLSSLLNNFIRQWESYERTKEGEYPTPLRKITEIRKKAEGFSKQIFNLLTDNDNIIEASIADQGHKVSDLIGTFSSSARVSPGQSILEATEAKGKEACEAAKALYKVLKQDQARS
jgi:hypothetical protein